MSIEGDLISVVRLKKCFCKEIPENLRTPKHIFFLQDSPKNFHTPPKRDKNFSYPDKTGLEIFIPPQHILHPPPGIKNVHPLNISS